MLFENHCRGQRGFEAMGRSHAQSHRERSAASRLRAAARCCREARSGNAGPAAVFAAGWMIRRSRGVNADNGGLTAPIGGVRACSMRASHRVNQFRRRPLVPRQHRVCSVPSDPITAVRRLCVTPSAAVPSRTTDTPNREAKRLNRVAIAGREMPDARIGADLFRVSRQHSWRIERRIETDRQQARRDLAAARRRGSPSWALLNCRSILGQKSGNGQRVYMNVTARTLALASLAKRTRSCRFRRSARRRARCSPGSQQVDRAAGAKAWRSRFVSSAFER